MDFKSDDREIKDESATSDASVFGEEESQDWNYFYEITVPEPDELVMVRVNSIDDMGVLCSLLEYNDLEGFLPLSEISRKRMRSVLRHVRVGQKQVLQVLRVDTERGYVDLSKKYIAGDEKELGSTKYEKGKHVHSITKRLAELTHQNQKDIFAKLTFPLYSSPDWKHPFEAFKALAAEDADIFTSLPKDGEEMSEEERVTLKKIVTQRMAVQPMKLGLQVEVTCYAEGGIDDIKKALRAGLASAPVTEEVSVQLLTSPTYLVWLSTIDEVRGSEALSTVGSAIKTSIEESGGTYMVVKEASAIGKDLEI